MHGEAAFPPPVEPGFSRVRPFMDWSKSETSDLDERWGGWRGAIRNRLLPISAFIIGQVGNIRLGRAVGRVARCHPKSVVADFGDHHWPSRKHPTWPAPSRVGGCGAISNTPPTPNPSPPRRGTPRRKCIVGTPPRSGG